MTLNITLRQLTTNPKEFVLALEYEYEERSFYSFPFPKRFNVKEIIIKCSELYQFFKIIRNSPSPKIVIDCWKITPTLNDGIALLKKYYDDNVIMFDTLL